MGSFGKLAASLICAVMALLLLAWPSAAGQPLKGVALIVGNGDYAHLAKLGNPPDDARAIEALLDRLGFDTTLVSDRNAKRLRRDLEGFVDDADGADVAILYYAGHGIEAGGENYLIPVDADLSALDSARERLVPLSEMLDELKRSVPVTIVMLDACRSNPFPPGALLRADPDAQPVAAAPAGLAATRGAVPLGDTAGEESFGTVIGFAAEPGQAALDGPAGGNSPYAAAVLRHLGAIGGAEFGTVMRMVAEEVYLKTGGRQRPWVNESLRRLLYFGGEAEEPPAEQGAILAERRKLLVTISALPEPGRRQIEAIAQSAAVPMDALYGMLAALGQQAPSDPAELEQLLRGQAERLKTMLAEREALNSEDPELQRLAGLADEAIAEGALASAVDILGKAKQRVGQLEKVVGDAEADIARKRAEFAAVYARSGEAHALGFENAAAAADYAAAFEQVERWDDKLAWTYKNAETIALHQEGHYRGSSPTLLKAAAEGEAALRLAERLSDPAYRATSQNQLGNIFQSLGEREAGPEHLQASAAAFGAALDVFSAAPGHEVEAARTRNNLANTLVILGARMGDAARLRDGAELYEEVIGRFEQAQAWDEWVAAQANYGRALLELGELTNSVETLTRASRAFDQALSGVDRTRQPLVWAGIYNNHGNVYQALAVRTADPNVAAGRYFEAIGAYAFALQEMTRERTPLQWASAQANLANVHQSMAAAQQSDAAAMLHLDAAASAQRLALEEITRERSPLEWGLISSNLGLTLQMMGDRGTGDAALARYREAEATFRAALGALTPDQAPVQWSNAKARLGRVLQALGEAEPDPAAARARLTEAAGLQKDAVERLPGAAPESIATLLHDRGTTLIMLGDRGGGLTAYGEAEAAYREALRLRSPERVPVEWGRSKAGLANATRAVAMATGDRALLAEARRLTRDAWRHLDRYTRQYDPILELRLRQIDIALAHI